MEGPEYMFLHEMIEQYNIQNKIKMEKFTPKL